jgi:hypothetical protein
VRAWNSMPSPLGERVDRTGVFFSLGGPGEGSVARRAGIRQARPPHSDRTRQHLLFRAQQSAPVILSAAKNLGSCFSFSAAGRQTTEMLRCAPSKITSFPRKRESSLFRTDVAPAPSASSGQAQGRLCAGVTTPGDFHLYAQATCGLSSSLAQFAVGSA